MKKFLFIAFIVVMAASARASKLSIESVRVIPVGPGAMLPAGSTSLQSNSAAQEAPPLMRPNPELTYYDWYWQWRYLWLGVIPMWRDRYPTLRVSQDSPTKGLDRLLLGVGDYSDTPPPAANSAGIVVAAEAPNDEIMGDGIFSERFMLATGDRVGRELSIRATLGDSLLRARVPRLARNIVLVFDCVSTENEGLERPLKVTISADGVRGVTSSSTLLLHSSMLVMKRIGAAKKKLAGLDDRISRKRQTGGSVSDAVAMSAAIASNIQTAEKRLYDRRLLQAIAEMSKAETKLDILTRQVR